MYIKKTYHTPKCPGLAPGGEKNFEKKIIVTNAVFRCHYAFENMCTCVRVRVCARVCMGVHVRIFARGGACVRAFCVHIHTFICVNTRKTAHFFNFSRSTNSTRVALDMRMSCATRVEFVDIVCDTCVCPFMSFILYRM